MTTVRGHLLADADYQRRSARFLENHDEPRAAATFPPQVHAAAAVLTLLAPGLRFVREGQSSGRRVRARGRLAAPGARGGLARESHLGSLQCYVRLPWSDIDGRAIVVRDLMSPVVRHERHGADLWRQGLYLDVPPWGYHVFEVTT